MATETKPDATCKDRRPSEGRRPAWLFAAIAVLLTLQVSWWWIPTPDSAQYLSMARNFAHGRVQRLGCPHLYYAPGYPAIIAPAFWLSDRPFLAVGLIHLGLALMTMLGTLLWLRRVARPMAPLLTALVMVNVGLWQHCRMILSETAFTAELIWTGHLLQQGVESRGWRRWAWLSAAAGLLTLTGITRHAGIMLVPGLGAAMAVRAWRGKETWGGAILTVILTGLPAILAVASLISWDHARAIRVNDPLLSYDQSMLDRSEVLLPRLVEGLRREAGDVGRLLIPGMYKAYAGKGDWWHPNNFLYAIFALALATGWWRMACRRADPLVWSFPFYFALYVIWPFDQGARFMIPMLPVLWVSFWGFVGRSRRSRQLFAALIILHAALAAVYWVHDVASCRLHALWPQWTRIARQLEPDLGRAGVYCLNGDHALMLDVAVDRHLAAFQPGDRIDSRIRWLVAPRDEPSPPDFELASTVGDCRILRRTEPTSALQRDGGRE